jgi:hypothetical protein
MSFQSYYTKLTSPYQSSRIADALTPALYSRIILRGPAQCMRTLDMLYSRPDRARHIRSLKVSPDPVITGRASRWGRSALPDGYAVSSVVRRAARNFEVLRCFAWDGEELPPYDDMWFALRILCVYHNRSRVRDNHTHSSSCGGFHLAVHISSSSRPRLGPSYPHRTVMCVAWLLPTLIVRLLGL